MDRIKYFICNLLSLKSISGFSESVTDNGYYVLGYIIFIILSNIKRSVVIFLSITALKIFSTWIWFGFLSHSHYSMSFMIPLRNAILSEAVYKDYLLYHAPVFFLVLLVIRRRILPDFIMTCSILFALVNTAFLCVTDAGLHKLYQHAFHYGIPPGSIGYDDYVGLLHAYPAFSKVIPLILTNVDYHFHALNLHAYMIQEMAMFPVIIVACTLLKFFNTYQRGVDYKKTILNCILSFIASYVIIGFVMAYWMSESGLPYDNGMGYRPTEYIPFLPFLWLQNAILDPLLLQVSAGVVILVVCTIVLLILLALASLVPPEFSSPQYTTTVVTQYVTGPPEVNDLIG